MPIEIDVGEPRAPAAATTADHETLSDWRDELACLATAAAGEIVIDARASRRLSARQAIEAVRSAFASSAHAVVVFVATERAAALARSIVADAAHRTVQRFRVGAVDVELRFADLVMVSADAIVNASNTSLRLGSGVSGALRVACGPRLAQALARIGGVPNGMVETPAFDLTRTRCILHVPTDTGSEEAVGAAYENVVRACASGRYRSVALPALGCGTGRLPPATSAALLLSALRELPSDTQTFQIIVACTEEEVHSAFEAVLSR